METVGKPPADVELHLLTNWGDPAGRARTGRAAVMSVLAHIAAIVLIAAVPESIMQPPARRGKGGLNVRAGSYRRVSVHRRGARIHQAAAGRAEDGNRGHAAHRAAEPAYAERTQHGQGGQGIQRHSYRAASPHPLAARAAGRSSAATSSGNSRAAYPQTAAGSRTAGTAQGGSQ